MSDPKNGNTFSIDRVDDADLGIGTAVVSATGDWSLPLTGERTIPGIPEENYWFRRHEVVYEWLLERCRDARVLEAGAGEGYGAAMIADVAERVIALDYDRSAIAHIREVYPRVHPVRGNLAGLPLPDDAVDVVVNLQVIEHLWDQVGFLRECLRVLRPGGSLIVSTPNRLTFSPGRDTPLNPFHTRELAPEELTELLIEAGFAVAEELGVRHAPTLARLDARHGGSIIDAQLERALAGEPWPDDLVADVAGVTTADFAITGTDLPTSLDLLTVAHRPTGR
ncbi:class I SAM-dependent methyltransferase [Millisia brevis]|uniref:class I SAM-dependent methyltransferase n=1 Tax=Millisia brevis TaxID=264148 RepID=UPI000A052DAA|nr:class I SAM-dependent methyltransferase [Millisia brevis]